MDVHTLDVKDLSARALDVVPVDFDPTEGYGDQWEDFNAAEVDGGFVSGRSGESQVEDLTRWAKDADGDFERIDRLDDRWDAFNKKEYVYMNEPVFNYMYPVPDFKYSRARGDFELGSVLLADAHVALCLIEKDEEAFLALTGGGMDMTEDIVDAYIALGYLPPVHFCSLPNFAGTRRTPKTLLRIEACQRALTLQKDWINDRLNRLLRYEEGLND